MKVAVIGSRTVQVNDMAVYLPTCTTMIISGGARGADACAREYALLHGILYREFLPDYRRYGKGAPGKRNLQIISHADLVVALWDGFSSGTKQVINFCIKRKIPLRVCLLSTAVSEN